MNKARCDTWGVYHSTQKTLKKRLQEKAPSLLQLLVGPRQIGKTTLLVHLAKELGPQAIYVSGDSPEASLSNWKDSIWKEAKELAKHKKAFLFIDEVQTIPNWSQWLKSHFDEILKKKIPLHVVASGSSSLKLGAGSRESMAGRFERLVLPHWGAEDLNKILKIPKKEAAHRLVAFGGYPGAVRLWNDLPRWENYLQHSIIEPAIGRDIMQLEPVRKPALLRQLFAIAAAHPAEIISLEKIAGLLAEKGALETLAHYLNLLQEAFLIAPVFKHGSEIRRRKSPPKLVVLNNALLAGAGVDASMLQKKNPHQWGRRVENNCLAYAINRGEKVTYWREEPWEVDGIFEGKRGKWLVEVKTGSYTQHNLVGLSKAASKFQNFEPLVLCDPGEEKTARAAGFKTLAWTQFLSGVWPE